MEHVWCWSKQRHHIEWVLKPSFAKPFHAQGRVASSSMLLDATFNIGTATTNNSNNHHHGSKKRCASRAHRLRNRSETDSIRESRSDTNHGRLVALNLVFQGAWVRHDLVSKICDSHGNHGPNAWADSSLLFLDANPCCSSAALPRKPVDAETTYPSLEEQADQTLRQEQETVSGICAGDGSLVVRQTGEILRRAVERSFQQMVVVELYHQKMIQQLPQSHCDIQA